MAPNKLLDKYIKEIANGNKDSLVSLYNETKVSVYAYALSILHNKALAEDVLQEVYIKIYENAYMYTSKNKPLAWILTIVKNTCLMHIRKEKNYQDLDLYKEVSTNKDQTDNKLFLSYLFNNITDEERQIIVLHVVSGFKHREIAKMMNLPVGTVLSKYKRTINKLQALQKEGFYE